ncbi:MAG: thiamine pyrophosphate-binding protein [Nitrospinae bacterium]|nr:thiamine pyrophosphate-binding protein [Nitrospinota bacterium]
MLSSKIFIGKLRDCGFNFFTGVPCSLLSGLIATLESDPDLGYIPSVREDAGVGLCAGAYLGGQQPVLLMQNSGLGYSLNAFTSLNLIYKIPVLVIMSWRGCGGKDAPEHLIMGDINEQLLETSRMEYAVLEEDNTDRVLADALKTINDERVPYTLLVKKGLFDERH